MKQVTDFPDYWVTEDGNVYSTITNKYLSTRCKRGSYPIVCLVKSKKRKHIRVHRLVAEAYLTKPKQAQCVNHIDGDKTNNHVSNLEWVTFRQNCQHAFDTGLQKRNEGKKGENNITAKLKDSEVVQIRTLRSNGWTLHALGDRFGVSFRTIWDITSGRRWRHLL